MSRKKSSREIPEEVKAMEVVAAKEEERKLAIEEADRLYLPEGESYNLHIALERAKFYQNQTANALIELGKQFILIKEHEGHGNFILAIEGLGMSERSVRYAMAAAKKFSNRQSTADLGSEKLRALTVLDDEEIESLDSGGKVEGIGTLDEISRMTVRELKAALREEKKKREEDREAQEAAIEQKEEKINELERELRYRQPPTKEELAQAEIDELWKTLHAEALSASTCVLRATQQFDRIRRIEGVNIDQLAAIAEMLGEPLTALEEYLKALGEAVDNPHPIVEAVPSCIEDM